MMDRPFIEAAVKIVAAYDRSQLSCSMDTKAALMRHISKANARLRYTHTATCGDGRVLESWRGQPYSVTSWVKSSYTPSAESRRSDSAPRSTQRPLENVRSVITGLLDVATEVA
jgi:hypothetical protein